MKALVEITKYNELTEAVKQVVLLEEPSLAIIKTAARTLAAQSNGLAVGGWGKMSKIFTREEAIKYCFDGIQNIMSRIETPKGCPMENPSKAIKRLANIMEYMATTDDYRTLTDHDFNVDTL